MTSLRKNRRMDIPPKLQPAGRVCANQDGCWWVTSGRDTEPQKLMMGNPHEVCERCKDREVDADVARARKQLESVV